MTDTEKLAAVREYLEKYEWDYYGVLEPLYDLFDMPYEIKCEYCE